MDFSVGTLPLLEATCSKITSTSLVKETFIYLSKNNSPAFIRSHGHIVGFPPGRNQGADKVGGKILKVAVSGYFMIK